LHRPPPGRVTFPLPCPRVPGVPTPEYSLCLPFSFHLVPMVLASTSRRVWLSKVDRFFQLTHIASTSSGAPTW
jgi:hypothetical protein